MKDVNNFFNLLYHRHCWLSRTFYRTQISLIDLEKQSFLRPSMIKVTQFSGFPLTSMSYLKTIRFTCTQDKNPNEKTQTMLFQLRQFFYLVELVTQFSSDLDKLLHINLLSLSFSILTSYNLLVYLIFLLSYAFSNLLTFLGHLIVVIFIYVQNLYVIDFLNRYCSSCYRPVSETSQTGP